MSYVSSGQECDITLSGYVQDEGTEERLPYVNILIEETGGGVVTDSLGLFAISDLCPGGYHIVFSHIGCASRELYIRVERDSIVTMDMEHSPHVLEDVTVTGANTQLKTQATASLNQQYIEDNAADNLANLLDNLTGVSTLKNGSGIAKPIVHGLYGNRLTILNNGIVQSGQQWGNDHSPEIDPLIANRLSVIKGVGALAYPGARLGGVVLIQPKRIDKEPHFHGKANYFYESNGHRHGLNLQAQQYVSSIGWSINGTLKTGGDQQTPDYFLRNTGSQEANLALQLEKSFSPQLTSNLYLSTFNTTLGILRGSHVGNLSDLEAAIGKEVPFFTESEFSRSIDAPKQGVNHHLLKLTTNYFINDNKWIEFVLSGQANIRKEFDVRRSGRSELPALSLSQMAYYAGIKYNNSSENGIDVKTGIETTVTDNTNNPETGILPLVPDYLSYESALFGIVSKTMDRHVIEAGLRYDNVIQNVVTIDGSRREVVRYNNIYHNLSTTFGWTYRATEHISASTNIGYATRNPAVNELYSAGLHQGVSGIEEGSVDLESEQAVKITVGLTGDIDERLSFEVLGYYQLFDNYIYLDPQDEFRLTIRGAFPVFRYEQTAARIYGLDVSSTWQMAEYMGASVGYSYIRGDDVDQNIALVNIPSDNLLAAINYEYPQPIQIGSKQLEALQIEINSRYQFRQSRITSEQDFLLPPDAYHLLGLKVSADIQLGKTRLRWYANVDNLLDVRYRDYLNRQRYFADDLGRSITSGVSLKF